MNSKIINILAILICIFAISNANAQSLSGSRTVAAANTVKTAKHTCSYVVAGGGLTTIATIKTYNANTEQQSEKQLININEDIIETTLYPNPFTDYATVKFGIKPDAQKPKITITDATGRTFYPSFNITEQTDYYMAVEIITTNLKQGRYIIRIISGDKIAAVKAIKL
ncbi:MAG: T9SS type A sorting domain-containing protein [Bacteroidales bacterium]|nr:T9SS type A sorting domain-containing protein [Bacteroidales bacterium]